MNKSADSTITITDLLNLCMARWRWFVASVVVCLLMAVYYLIKTPYLYMREATVMVLEESLGDNTSEKSHNSFNNIGFVRQKSSVFNVMRHITSLDVLMEVARRAHPDVPEAEIINVARDIQSRLTATNSNAEMRSTIIDLSYKDHSTVEAYNILSLVIQVYGERWVDYRLEVTRNTSKFIKERLALLEQELGIVDDSIAKYKSTYGITNLEHVSDIYLQQQSQSDAEIMRLVSQQEMAGYIRELLEDEKSTNQLLLANSGINNNGIEAQITMYNNMVLELQGHLKYTSEQNPMIVYQQEQIASLRQKILSNIINYIHSIDIQLESLIDYHNEATDKVTSNPAQANYLATIERERTVKESLYMFLLQKMEENEISSTYQTTNIQMIDLPHGSGKPTSPKRQRVLFAALLFGFLIPTTVIFLRASMDEGIRNHRDIECRPAIPFLAEVPMSERIGTISTLQRLFKLKPETKGIVFAEGKQTPINEAFRLIIYTGDAPKNKKDLNIIMLFPNTQDGQWPRGNYPKNDYKGNIGTKRGDVVQLMYYPTLADGNLDLNNGSKYFPKGTKIGFILKANSWGCLGSNYSVNTCTSKINIWGASTDGLSQSPSSGVNFPNKNGDSRAAKFAYTAPDGNTYVAVTFEDACDDKDYDDLVFALNPANAFDFSDVAQIESRVDTTYSVYAFEDMWPDAGDYDMNDIVVECEHEKEFYKHGNDEQQNGLAREIFKLTTYKNSADKISGLGVRVTNDASIATIYASKIPKGQTEPVVTNKMESKKYYWLSEFELKREDINNKENMFFYLTDNINKELGTTYTLDVTYSNSQKKSMSNIELFIYRKEKDGKYWEVHLPLKEPTSRVQPNYFGTLADRTDWGSRTNYYTRSGDYPFAFLLEGVSIDMFKSTILDVNNEGKNIDFFFPGFIDWSRSNGKTNQDWYLHPVEEVE